MVRGLEAVVGVRKIESDFDHVKSLKAVIEVLKDETKVPVDLVIKSLQAIVDVRKIESDFDNVKSIEAVIGVLKTGEEDGGIYIYFE